MRAVRAGYSHKITLFKTRSKSDVGAAYCNKSLADQWPDAFTAFTIGCEFLAPIVDGVRNSADEGNLPAVSSLFQSTIPQHCAVSLTIANDEMLKSTVGMMPGGVGIVGNIEASSASDGTVGDGIASTLGNNGRAMRNNRWQMKQLLEIPKGESVQVDLEFSEVAREMLSKMVGPVDTVHTHTLSSTQPYCSQAALIRFSLFGVRGLQFRQARSAS